MIDRLQNLLLTLTPKTTINFPNAFTSLVRTMNQPVIDDLNGLIIFGDSSALYIGLVGEQGTRYKLPVIKAATYIHGWVISSGILYVVDGIELAMWNLGDAEKRHVLKLVADDDAGTAVKALDELNAATQSADWAALLEQAEEEWTRLTIQQAAAPSPSDERDRLDALAASYFAMLVAIRKMVGSTGGSAAARQKIAELRKTLADKRKAAAPWSFSAPVVREHEFQEGQTGVFVMQGNGTIHGCSKQLGNHKQTICKDEAELQIALLDDETAAPKLLAYVSGSTLHVIEPNTFAEKSSWTPATKVNKTYSLTIANGQFWWSTDSGVYACKPDTDSKLQATWHSGAPWSVRQVGRVEVPNTIYHPQPDPNELFESMNILGWLAARSDRSAPLNDGMTAQLMLSDENGRYVAPPPGTTHVLYGPFSRDASATSTWGEVRAHPRSSFVLLSDSTNSTILCRYPSPAGISQLLPQWVVSPHFYVPRSSAGDIALAQPWPAPAVRPLTKPHPDMIDFFHKSAAKDALTQYENVIHGLRTEQRMTDRDLRYVLWYPTLGRQFNEMPVMKNILNDAAAKRVLDIFYTDAQVQALRKQFDGLGTVWDVQPGDSSDTAHFSHFYAKNPPVDFDPPYLWKTHPSPSLFHKPPPPWYDPWGYNRPGDFVSQQPAATYLDPFCFNGQPRFPQRAVSLERKFQGHQWAVFTDTHSTALSSESSDTTSDPSILVLNTDEDMRRTTAYVLPARRLIVTYDAPSHEVHPETLPYAFIAEQIVGCPTVFLVPAKIYPVAWCVGAKEYPSARLRNIASVDPTKHVSGWDTWVAANRTKYGPTDGTTAWRIGECPLPSDAVPAVNLYGYLLPAPH